MTSSEKRVEDLETLKAIAHPLRMKLLGALRQFGPATASELGRRFGESSGSTSYHLRQLERFGFVGDDPQPSRRERYWKALHVMTNIQSQKFQDTELGQMLSKAASGYAVDYLIGNIDRFLEAEVAAPWQGTLGVNDYLLRLDPDTAKELMDGLDSLLESFRERQSTSPEALPIAWHLLALPAEQK